MGQPVPPLLPGLPYATDLKSVIILANMLRARLIQTGGAGPAGPTGPTGGCCMTGATGASPPVTYFGIDGVTTNGGGTDHIPSGMTQGSVTLSTTRRNDVIVMFVASSMTVGGGAQIPVVSVSDTAGLTWKKLAAYLYTGFSANAGIEVWWAVSAGVLTNDVITVSMDATSPTNAAYDGADLIAFGVAGAKTSAPWDANGALPAVATGTTSPAQADATTTAVNTILLAFGGSSNNDALTFTGPIGSATMLAALDYFVGDSYKTAGVAYQIVSAAQASTPVGMTLLTGGADTPNWGLIVHAMVKGP